MRRIRPPRRLAGALAVAATALALPTGASALPTPATNDAAGAQQLAQALADPSTQLGTASFVSVPTQGTPNGTGTAAFSFFPSQGRSTYAVLTNGAAADVQNGSNLNNDLAQTVPARGISSTGAALAHDVSVLKVPVTVPTGANCLTFDFAMYSREYPAFVNSPFNDAFVAELDTDDWSLAFDRGANGGQGQTTVNAPNNFAFDTTGKAVSVNTASFSKANAAGTGFANYGATSLLSASKQVTPGAHTLYLSIFDSGDGAVDSAVVADALRVGFVPNPAVNCKSGAQPVLYAMQVAPTTGSGYVDVPHEVTATVTDSNGNPIKGAPVGFTVSGPNARTGTATTGDDGVAHYTYTGTDPGTDSIAACYDADGDGTCEATGSATYDWVAGPKVSIGPASVTEGNAGTTDAKVPVTLDAPATADVSVKYATSDGTATAGEDYTATSGTLTIPAGDTTGSIVVPVLGDTKLEGDETVHVTLSDPRIARIDPDHATADLTIRNDDAAPSPAPAPTPAPTAVAPASAADICGRLVSLLDVSSSGSKVHVAGMAKPKYVGSKVSILAGGKQVGTTTVRPDGTFEADVPGPAASRRGTIRYQATVGRAFSRSLKLERLLTVTKRDGLTVEGRIDAAASRLPSKVTFYRRQTCTRERKFTSAKVDAKGRFTVKLAEPYAGEPYALFRVSARLGDDRTFSLPLAVR